MEEEEYLRRLITAHNQNPMQVGGLTRKSTVTKVFMSTITCVICDKHPLFSPHYSDKIGGFSDQAVALIGCSHWICMACYDIPTRNARVCPVCTSGVIGPSNGLLVFET